MNDNCNKLINTMIEKGADPKIFDMPAMRERIENGMIKDMSVNSDGTIDFNGYHMERNKEYKGITLERISEKQGEVHYINNDPIGDNGHAVYSITAEKISINEYGIEEKIEIKEDKGGSKDKWENVKLHLDYLRNNQNQFLTPNHCYHQMKNFLHFFLRKILLNLNKRCLHRR